MGGGVGVGGARRQVGGHLRGRRRRQGEEGAAARRGGGAGAGRHARPRDAHPRLRAGLGDALGRPEPDGALCRRRRGGAAVCARGARRRRRPPARRRGAARLPPASRRGRALPAPTPPPASGALLRRVSAAQPLGASRSAGRRQVGRRVRHRAPPGGERRPRAGEAGAGARRRLVRPARRQRVGLAPPSVGEGRLRMCALPFPPCLPRSLARPLSTLPPSPRAQLEGHVPPNHGSGMDEFKGASSKSSRATPSWSPTRGRSAASRSRRCAARVFGGNMVDKSRHGGEGGTA